MSPSGSPVSLTSWETCSSILPRQERFDAPVSVKNGDFKKFVKNPESGTGGWEAWHDAMDEYFGYDMPSYPLLEVTQMHNASDRNYFTVPVNIMCGSTVCNYDAAHGGGKTEVYLLQFDCSIEDYELYYQYYRSTHLQLSFYIPTESIPWWKLVYAPIACTVPYLDDSFRRIANVVNDSLATGGLKREQKAPGGLGLISFLICLFDAIAYGLCFVPFHYINCNLHFNLNGARTVTSRAIPTRFILLLLISYYFSKVDACTLWMAADHRVGRSRARW